MLSILPGRAIGLLGVALVHAVVLSVMITATMAISGGHLNPAVTIGLLSVRRIDAEDRRRSTSWRSSSARRSAPDCCGWCLPSGIVRVGTLGTPVLANAMNMMDGILLEAVLTFFLVSAVFGTAVSSDAPKVGGFAIGLVLLFDILIGGTLTGCGDEPGARLRPRADQRYLVRPAGLVDRPDPGRASSPRSCGRGCCSRRGE